MERPRCWRRRARPVLSRGRSRACSTIACCAVPLRKLPAFATTVIALARMADGDVLYASKPKLGSAGVGYLKRATSGRPLLLDIDDWEMGFLLRGGFFGTVGRSFNVLNPSGLPWTWLAERLRRAADGITVASR